MFNKICIYFVSDILLRDHIKSDLLIIFFQQFHIQRIQLRIIASIPILRQLIQLPINFASSPLTVEVAPAKFLSLSMRGGGEQNSITTSSYEKEENSNH